MCIHDESLRKRMDEAWQSDNRPIRNLVLRRKSGQLIAAYPARYSDARSVANTIRDIKYWHDDAPNDAWVDLSAINEARLADGLESLDNNGLPIAVGDPMSQDMDVDLLVRGRDGLTEFERGLQRYIKAQEKQLEAVSV